MDVIRNEQYMHKKQQTLVRMRSARKVWNDKVNSIHKLEVTHEFLIGRMKPETFIDHLILMGYALEDMLDFVDGLFYSAARKEK